MPTTATEGAPARAEGLQLLGAPAGSGYRDAPALVRRSDGQTLQVSPMLHELLDLVDGHRDLDALAVALSERVGRRATADDVAALLGKLEPLGLLAGGSGPPPKSNPLLALRCKVVISDPAATRRLTAPFAALFRPVVLWPVLAAFVVVCWFVLVEKGLAPATRQAFDTPGLLLAVFALTVASAGLHELGHAAACRYGGAQPGAMGAGLYLAWPAFYTDVDDAYRLDRRGRLRVDLGGLYFNAVVAVAVAAAYLLTGVEALLLGIATQLLQMLRQLAPVLRADGYHVLSDLTGVPDLFAHLGPTLRRMVPGHGLGPSPLTRRARVIVTAWVLVVVPVLLAMMATAVLLLPRMLATAWSSGHDVAAALGSGAERGDLLTVGAALLELLALLVPVVGVTYLVGRVVRRTATSTWRATDGRPVRRALAVLAGAAVLLALLWAWWPSGQYDPVRSDERGTLTDLVTTPWETRSASTPLVTAPAARQELALAMVPREGDGPVLLVTGSGDSTRAVVTGREGGAARAFPFALPDPTDTQAVALNSGDGTTVYDVAYALVTVTDGQVTTSNSAWALASCTDCTTLAVSFQVVLVVGSSDVAVPVNAAVAANADCLRCTTAALATQLVVTLAEAPSAQLTSDLEKALQGLDGLDGLDLQAAVDRVLQVQQDVTKVLVDAGLAPATTQATATATPSTSPATSTPDPTTASPEPTATGTPAPSPTATPTASPTPSATG